MNSSGLVECISVLHLLVLNDLVFEGYIQPWGWRYLSIDYNAMDALQKKKPTREVNCW